MDTTERYANWSRRIAASDETAFEALFLELHTPLVRFAASLTGSADVAEDLVQDAFVRIWNTRERLDPERSLRALLYHSVRNLSYNAIRDRNTQAERRKEMTRFDRPVRPDAQTEAAALSERLGEWIGALPDRQREALTLSRVNGLSHDEIAATMDVSPRTVNNHIVAGLKVLRKHLLAYEPALLDR